MADILVLKVAANILGPKESHDQGNPHRHWFTRRIVTIEPPTLGPNISGSTDPSFDSKGTLMRITAMLGQPLMFALTQAIGQS
jgi:hypothetical protein